METEQQHTFQGLGIAPQMLNILDEIKFTHATPIQHKVIPVALDGNDVIGVAQTGTGKTIAYVIPLLQRLASTKGKALILVPTRELAIQVEESLLKFAESVKIGSAVFIGGDPIKRQLNALAKKPRVLIATPGRFNDLLERRLVNIKDVGILVLDEADRMLDMGFEPQINRIVRYLPVDRQTMLFSATMPSSIVYLTKQYMKCPVRVEVAPSGTAAEGVTHELFIVNPSKKMDLVKKLLDQYRGSVLMFCRTKTGTAHVARSLHTLGYSATAIHAN
ncbi:MAG: ATP-dependent RNA helicase, partial [uncultured bacterium]